MAVVTSLTRRAYVDGDLPRLQGALAEWRRTAGGCGYCHVGDLPHRIYDELHARGPVGSLVSVWSRSDGSGIAGVAIAMRHAESFDVFTAPALRGTDAEEAMLRAAYETTRRHMTAAGRGDDPVVTDVYGCDEVRAALLERLGFARYRMWDQVTERGLAAPVPPVVVPDGFVVRPARVADCAGLAEVRNSAFGSAWTGEEFRDAVMRAPGYAAEREVVAVAPDGRVAAFTVTWLDEVNRVGLFEPVGTHAEFRRLGLARAVLAYGLRAMRDTGMASVLVEHDATNIGAAALYRGLGFVTEYETYGYRRSGSLDSA